MNIQFSLQKILHFCFSLAIVFVALTLSMSPNLVQGALDSYNSYYDDSRPEETPVEEVERKETEQEAVQDAILRKTIDTNVRTTITHIKLLSNRKREFSIANANYAQYSTSGLNAGNTVSGIAGWLTIPYSDFKDNSFTDNLSNFDGKSINYIAGMDMVVNTRLALGVSLGYEDSEIKFNDSSKTDTHGLFGTLYSAYNFSDYTAYIIGGYGTGENNPTNTKGYDSSSFSLTGGALADFELARNISLNVDASYTYAESTSDSYISNNLLISPDDTILSQLHLNFELARIMEWGEFYGLLGSRFDLYDDDDDAHDNGRYAVDLGIGTRFYANEVFSGDISIKKMFLRKNEENVTITFGVRYQF
jgi:hypothetical protein